MKRMNLIIDEEALGKARRLTGKKTYSATVNHLLNEKVRTDRLMKAIRALDAIPDPWLPGYVDEYGPKPPEREKAPRRSRVAAKSVRAPRRSKGNGRLRSR
jgi:hypothetical protein